MSLAGLSVGAARRALASRFTSSETPVLDAKVFLKHVLKTDEAGLILREGEALSDAETDTLDALAHRREKGEPVAYILGEKEFFGLNFGLVPGVLVPRPDTETLVNAVLEATGEDEAFSLLDLGCGAGAIALSILAHRPAARAVMVDRNPVAAGLAFKNAGRIGLAGRVHVLAADWAAPIDGAFDVIVSNPPYIPEGDRAGLAPSITDYEDPGALFAGEDGLDAYRSIIARINRNGLWRGGLLGFEVGKGQAQTVADLVSAAIPNALTGFREDLSGVQRVVMASLRKKAL